MKKLLVLILFILTNIAYAQTPNSLNHEKTTPSFGIELDALPFITGGYYGSTWVGIDKFRFRGIIAQVKSPDFIIADGFENLVTTSYTLITDYFPFKDGEKYSGLWLGMGYEYWKNDITNKSNKAEGRYYNSVLTFGGGYIISIYKSLYINPWAAGHISLSGTSEINVGSKIYKPKVILPEISIKIGMNI